MKVVSLIALLNTIKVASSDFAKITAKNTIFRLLFRGWSLKTFNTSRYFLHTKPFTHGTW